MKYRTWVPIEQLQVGMRMIDLDLPWMATPFLRHRMLLRDRHQIERIRTCGARYVEIETDEPPDVSDALATAIHAAGNVATPASPSPQAGSCEPAGYVEELDHSSLAINLADYLRKPQHHSVE
jgi:hypothetical protein